MRLARSTGLSLLALAAAVALAAPATADEGMWTLDQIGRLDQAELHTRGLELDPLEIWNTTAGGGLASACVWLGGCSASFVSPNGLILTNHHCAFGAAQLNSTPERNLITEGFLASNEGEELPAPGTHVDVLDGFNDVTDRVLGAVPDGADDAARHAAIEQAEKELVKECEADGTLRCRVAAMWGGLTYVLYRQLDLRDVRLVHIPARGIGEFGGDTDNWMWPRHTGDYAVLRAYVGPDGKPADYSKDNVPYHPKRWLRLSDRGIGDGSFAFVIGYPGRTMRYRSSWAVEEAQSFSYPERIRLLTTLIATREASSKGRPEAAIKNASAIKYMNNGLKNNQGMLAGFSHWNLVAEKRAREAELASWIAASPERQARYGDVLPGLAATYAEVRATEHRDMVFSWLFRSSSLLSAAETVVRTAEERAKPDLERDPKYMERNLSRLRQRLRRMSRSLDLPSDRASLRVLLLEADKLPAGQRIEALDRLVFRGRRTPEAAVDAFLDTLYATPVLANEDARLALFAAPLDEVIASKDRFLQLALALQPERRAITERDDRIDGAFEKLRPLYAQAIAESTSGPMYPDANSTVRFNFGSVRGYSPADAVHYSWLTSLQGVLAKDTDAPPFDSPAAFLEAARTTEPGPYRDTTIHDVPVDFLATLDSTGGNSGSPVMNGSGELIGLLFDGNYEAMASDWKFDPELTRSIMVDIRYVLWVMDRVYHADWLIREMSDPFRVLTPAPEADKAK